MSFHGGDAATKHVTIIIDGYRKVDYGDDLESEAETPIRSAFVASERNGLHARMSHALK